MTVLRAATITVADVAAASARYERWFDYEIVEKGRLDADLARAWGGPDNAGRAMATLRPASGRAVYLRLVEGEKCPGPAPFASLGWTAIELCVTDVLATQDRLRSSPFAIVGPAEREPSLPTIFPMQVLGPDDENIYLTQILSDRPEYRLPRAQSPIDHLFILVLGSADIVVAVEWFAATIGAIPGRRIEMPHRLLQQAFRTPGDGRFALSTMTHEGEVFLELDQYPPAAARRPAHPDALPPGISIGTFAVSDLDRITAPLIARPALHGGPIYGGRRAGCVRTPEGALVELVEAAPRH